MRIPGLRTVKKAWRRLNQHGLILMYHRVYEKTDTSDPWLLCVTPRHFEEHLQVIKRVALPVRLSEMADNLPAFPGRQNQVVLTFDDGYRDNVLVALPLLQKHDVPASFYVVSGAVGAACEFWWDELERVILRQQKLPDPFEIKIGSENFSWRLSEGPGEKSSVYSKEHPGVLENNQPAGGRILYQSLWNLLKAFSESRKREILSEICRKAGAGPNPRESHLPVTAAQLRELAGCRLCEVGAHTASHPMLAHLTPGEQEKEIAQGKSALEEMVGSPVTSFTYPHGSYTPETLDIVRRIGFKNAATVFEETVTRKAHPYKLPRFMVKDWDGEEFERRLRGWITLKN